MNENFFLRDGKWLSKDQLLAYNEGKLNPVVNEPAEIIINSIEIMSPESIVIPGEIIPTEPVTTEVTLSRAEKLAFVRANGVNPKGTISNVDLEVEYNKIINKDNA